MKFRPLMSVAAAAALIIAKTRAYGRNIKYMN